MAEFLYWFPGYTAETALQMQVRQFFSLRRQIKRLRARRNYDQWLMVNYSNFTKEFREQIIQGVIRDAFPDGETGETQGNAGAGEPYWMNPKPGLRLVV